MLKAIIFLIGECIQRIGVNFVSFPKSKLAFSSRRFLSVDTVEPFILAGGAGGCDMFLFLFFVIRSCNTAAHRESSSNFFNS